MSQDDSSTDAILAQLAKMQATLDAQQAAIVALQLENAQLRAALSAEPTTPGAISPATSAAASEPIETAESAGAHESQPRAGLTSRRGLLRGAAAATAAATVGVAALGATETAHAAPLANGDNLIIGQTNAATAITELDNTNSGLLHAFLVTTTAGAGLQTAIRGSSLNGAVGVVGQDAKNGVGVYGYTQGTAGTGVYGSSTDGSGVLGQALGNGIGVFGSASGSGDAVHGLTQESIAVNGVATDAGWGLAGQSGVGYDFVANGTGIIGINVQLSVGAPTSGSFTIGDCIRDANGDLWLCTATGNPGAWVMALHVVPGMTGGAINYLSKPIRLLDTRVGQSALNHPGAPYAANSTHTIQVAGVTYNSVTIPATCAGAIGNLTVVGGAGTGNYVALVPSGVPFSGTANIAFTAGQVVSNSYNVGLSSAGKLDIIMGGGGTSGADVILDLFAIVS